MEPPEEAKQKNKKSRHPGRLTTMQTDSLTDRQAQAPTLGISRQMDNPADRLTD